MKKNKENTTPAWIKNLQRLMAEQELNPRSLSLKAGLNATAVRDMVEGRSRFPRYDTAQALAEALGVTAAQLMSDGKTASTVARKGKAFEQDFDLLTEIIARLEEVTSTTRRRLPPRDFAAMAITILQSLSGTDIGKNKQSTIGTHIHNLLDYETLRRKKAR